MEDIQGVDGWLHRVQTFMNPVSATKMGKVDWSILSDHYCGSSCAELKARSGELSGQRILMRAEPEWPVEISLTYRSTILGINSTYTLRMSNQMSEESAFTMLHFMHHVDRDACFHHLYYDSEEFATCLPFNGAIMDLLAAVRSRKGETGGWIRAKLDMIDKSVDSSPDGLENYRLQLDDWLRLEWLSDEYVWAMLPDFMLKSLTGYGKQYTQKKMVIDLTSFLPRGWYRRWDRWVDRMFERIIQSITDQPPDLSEVVPTLVIYMPMGWQGWRALWPGIIGDRTELINGEVAVIRLPQVDEFDSAATHKLEVKICYGVRRIRGTSAFHFFLEPSATPVCRVTVRVMENSDY